MTSIKVTYYICNSLFLVAWCIAVSFSKGAELTSVEQELEDEEDAQDMYDRDSDGESANEA